MSIVNNIRIIRLSLIGMIAILLVMMGCQAEEPEIKLNSGLTADPVPAPTLQMGVPGSMKYSTASSSISSSQDGYSAAITTETDENGCPALKEGENLFENGYTMTKFLVVLSENQACWADLLMTATHASYINEGKISTGNTTGLSAYQIDQSGDTYQLWFWFASAASPTFYMTWTGTSSTNSSGRFINAQLSDATADLSAVRFEFTRSTTSAVNKIYVKYANDASFDAEGFHSEVTKTTSGSVISYVAKGILSFKSQFGDNIPADVTEKPNLSMVTVSDGDGKGAAIADFTNVAIRFKDTTWDLGAYLFTLKDRLYFDANGASEWQKKEITTATYAGSTVRSGIDLLTIIDCLQINSCFGETIDLPDTYFTSPCDATDNADCTDFIQAVYETGWGGNYDNSDTAEDTNDGRYTELNNAVQLTTVWPSGATEGTDDFTVPTP